MTRSWTWPGRAGRSSRSPCDAAGAGYFDRAAGWLVLRGTPLLRRAEFPLAGDHNVQNALAAAVAMPPEAGPARRLAEGLRTFRRCEHRLEPVREVGGVRWINDSKSTSVAATVVAVRSMDRPVRAPAGRPAQGRALHRPPAAARRGARGRGRVRRRGPHRRRGPRRRGAARAGRGLRGRGRAGAAPGPAGRRRAPLPGLLELRHVRRLRGARPLFKQLVEAL